MSFVTGAHNSIQNTPQPLVSALLRVKSEEMEGVIELPSRPSSPTSDVSVSRYFCSKANHIVDIAMLVIVDKRTITLM